MDKMQADIKASGLRAGFKTENAAYRSAVRQGLTGLTGSGQQCGPEQLNDGSWAYWTAHNYFHPHREPGRLVLPRRVIDLSEIRAEAPRLPECIAVPVVAFAVEQAILSMADEMMNPIDFARYRH